ncbi:hypothetical protein HF072_12815 [Bacillus sp. RO3]|nr:hypothetical protein [Bacillus sp. RO3]
MNINFEDKPDAVNKKPSKSKTYQDQSNTFLLAKLSESKAQMEIVKNEYVKAETSRILWKLTAFIATAILIGRWLGGTL